MSLHDVVICTQALVRLFFFKYPLIVIHKDCSEKKIDRMDLTSSALPSLPFPFLSLSDVALM